nr:hypothetical protein OH837_04260 [Streptomyces canus]
MTARGSRHRPLGILADALSLGGTVTGEHGVGLPKDALDPRGLLNPGKVPGPRAPLGTPD